MSGLFNEAANAKPSLAATLAAGVEQISASQTISFTRYVRVVLPLDGYVFWISSALVNAGPAAIGNLPQFNAVEPNQSFVGGAPDTLIVPGSFHVDIERRQEQTQTIDVNRVVFTAESPVPELDIVAPNTLWIGTFTPGDGSEGSVRFAFSGRQNYYQQADLWHYVGDAIYPEMQSQIIDAVAQFDTLNVVVSNSLPIWLAFDQMNPPFPFPARQQVPLYPSFLVPNNAVPPYGAVHIEEGTTLAIQAAPWLDRDYSQWQLTSETVRITLYGTRNFNVMDFIQYVQFMAGQYEPTFGIMNIPVPHDEKSTQRELATIAMKKTVTFEINYYQSRMRSIARQLIKSVVPQYFIGDL